MYKSIKHYVKTRSNKTNSVTNSNLSNKTNSVHCQSSTSEELNKFSIESDIVLAEIC